MTALEAIELSLTFLRIIADSWPLAATVVAVYLIGTIRRMHREAVSK